MMMSSTSQAPYVKNTFVCVDPPRETAPPAVRARSVSPRGCSDAFARQLYSLLYRPTPVRQRCSRPVAICTPEAEDEKVSPKILLRGEETDLGSTLGSRSTDTGPGCSSAESTSGASSPRSPEAELSEEELLRVVPRDEAGNPLSLGSVGHDEGTCRPCVFAYNENKRCENGLRCSFCHYQHPPKKRVRLCKKKRMELKRQQELEEEQAE